MADEPQRFRSNVGHQPTFFVPDTGTPGGTAALTTPKGKRLNVGDPSVLSQGETFGARVGFKVPERFAYEGEYTLTVDQDGVITEYVIEVRPHRRWWTDPVTGKRSLRDDITEGELEVVA